ncbi:MAG: hypothetical protein M1498_02545, partial [Candidatus Thermoplasmatota archaeon]|nr:hypothetical protein [Candidatus Thermoplasmatota archaeon]
NERTLSLKPILRLAAIKKNSSVLGIHFSCGKLKNDNKKMASASHAMVRILIFSHLLGPIIVLSSFKADIFYFAVTSHFIYL